LSSSALIANIRLSVYIQCRPGAAHSSGPQKPTLRAKCSPSCLARSPHSDRVDESGERRRELPATRVVEIEARKRRTPVRENSHQLGRTNAIAPAYAGSARSSELAEVARRPDLHEGSGRRCYDRFLSINSCVGRPPARAIDDALSVLLTRRPRTVDGRVRSKRPSTRRRVTTRNASALKVTRKPATPRPIQLSDSRSIATTSSVAPALGQGGTSDQKQPSLAAAWPTGRFPRALLQR
jgi:hypothetical protein